MHLNVNTPTIDGKGIIRGDIFCSELNASARVEIGFLDLLPFASASDKKAIDLFLVASFVYGIDRFIERHSNSVDGWSRELDVKLPVYEPRSWNKLSNEVNELLSFLTGDYWEVQFTQSDLKLPEAEKPGISNRKFSQVNLFSGGLDSLIGALDFLKGKPKERVLLVSHFDPHISARQEQKDLIEKLNAKYPSGFDFIPSIGVSLSFTQLEKEKTFRSRSLLFISLAVLTAQNQNIPILVPENGTVSLNYPLSSSRRSACSTRTTHPSFLDGVRTLLEKLNFNSLISNPYDSSTKGEMVAACKDLELLKSIVGASNSCGKRGHRINWTYKDKSHCGICMPCIYRQAALQNIFDPTEYGNSINKKFTGRHNQTPFFRSKQGQDFNACLYFLKKEMSDGEIRDELLVNGMKDIEKLNTYLELVKRTRAELKDWIKKAGDASVKQKLGLA